MNISARMPKITFGGIVWVLLLGFVAYRMAPQVKAAFGAGTGNVTAPVVELRTLEGDVVTLDEYRGKVVLVNFWATWCPPCRIEMPSFQRVYEAKADEGFVILGLSTDQAGESAVREFLTKRGITFPVAMANGQVIQEFGGIQALPTSILIGRDGRIRQEVKGFFVEPALRMAVNRLLDEPVPLEIGGGRDRDE